MKRKNIDSLREIRLWIGQVIVPAVVGLGALNKMYPQTKFKLKNKVNSFKERIKNIF